MEKIMIVQQLAEDGVALLCPEKKSCAGCDACTSRHREERMQRFRANNPVGAQVGDRVTVSVSRKSVFLTAFRIYVVPVLLFLAGYILGEELWGIGPMTGMGGLLLALVMVTAYDRLVYRKKCRFTITGLAPRKKESC